MSDDQRDDPASRRSPILDPRVLAAVSAVVLVAGVIGATLALSLNGDRSSPPPDTRPALLPALPHVTGRLFEGGYSFTAPGRFPDVLDAVNPLGVRVVTTTAPECPRCDVSLRNVRHLVDRADPRVGMAVVMVQQPDSRDELAPFPMQDDDTILVERPDGPLEGLPVPTTVVVGADGGTIDWITGVVAGEEQLRRLGRAVDDGVAAAPPTDLPGWAERQLPGLVAIPVHAIPPPSSAGFGDVRLDYRQARTLATGGDGGVWAVPFAGARGIALVDRGHPLRGRSLPLRPRSPILASVSTARTGDRGIIAGVALGTVRVVEGLRADGTVMCSAPVARNVWSCTYDASDGSALVEIRVTMRDGSEFVPPMAG